jgi:ketosteroid isomerase-like protein
MVIAALLSVALVAAPLPEPPAPEATASAFIDAFRAMDEARFDRFFAPDVTMFFPDGPFPKERVEGRVAVLAAFHSFFKRVKERGRTTLNIAPLDLRVDGYADVAVVTFRLDNAESVGRRSVILRKVAGEWRIAHFHASTIDK